ncbi:hypothetical protein HGRIS_008547 [Hohenbuehelia grisea]|uniref:F-box domain-containing protein n=1 Tax=Hohenbuehelia grisea TaxID=104357 RepID=A0ABR3J8A3_9AGAR
MLRLRQELWPRTKFKPGNIPLELIAYTFRFLGLSDIRACTIVCKNWSPHAQFHLFRRGTVVLRPDRLDRFILVFEQNPSLYGYMTSLTLRRIGPDFQRDELIQAKIHGSHLPSLTSLSLVNIDLTEAHDGLDLYLVTAFPRLENFQSPC